MSSSSPGAFTWKTKTTIWTFGIKLVYGRALVFPLAYCSSRWTICCWYLTLDSLLIWTSQIGNICLSLCVWQLKTHQWDDIIPPLKCALVMAVGLGCGCCITTCCNPGVIPCSQIIISNGNFTFSLLNCQHCTLQSFFHCFLFVLHTTDVCLPTIVNVSFLV